LVGWAKELVFTKPPTLFGRGVEKQVGFGVADAERETTSDQENALLASVGGEHFPGNRREGDVIDQLHTAVALETV